MTDSPYGAAGALHYAWARLQRAWHLSARTVDLPVEVDQWLRLLAKPRPLRGPVSWGLALGDYYADAGGARPSALGKLVSAWRDRGDEDAADVLSALLVRWLTMMEIQEYFDFMVTYPESLLSGPPGGAAGLLARCAPASPLKWFSDCWTLRSAHSWVPESLRVVEDSTELHIGVHSGVRGKRLLFIDDGPTPMSWTAPWIHRLLAADASRVGLLAVCARSGGEHEC